MAWYDEAIFYHIYPLGMTGAPKRNAYREPVHRLNTLLSWIPHIKEIGCNGIYIGPLFESVGHGYETTDYKKVDSRLGTNEDLTRFVSECHKQGIRVILDGVFNHTGRDFFVFQDLKRNRENSHYKDWYCNVNFRGNNSAHDGFSYEGWGGHDSLPKLNQKNPVVRDYICEVIRFWVSEYDIDGIRLDAADVLDFDYMKAMRRVANEVKTDFWLMGEVIHGDYSRWANETTLHSVTNYALHKALYSAHNEHNYFEIAHTIKYVNETVGDCRKLYTFVDNHDVERINTKLKNKADFVPVHILLYTLPGIPAIYYGSEFGIEGRKEKYSDDSLRPALNFEDYKDAVKTNSHTKLIAALGKIRRNTPALCYGEYCELELQTTHFAYKRTLDGQSVSITVNNGDKPVCMKLACGKAGEYVGALTGERIRVSGGYLQVNVPAHSGEIWIPAEICGSSFAPIKDVMITKEVKAQKAPETEKKEEKKQEKQEAQEIQETQEKQKPVPESVNVHDDAAQKKVVVDWSKRYEDMSIEELQEVILEKMRKNGPVTEYMLGTVRENIWHQSLVTWAKSFQ